jgi:hypothetical protein
VKLDVVRVPVNRQGYDARGRYWGTGERLWRVSGEDGDREIDEHVRAESAREARRVVAARRGVVGTARERKQRLSAGAQFAAVLRGNADDYHRHRIDYEQFAKTQREVWASIDRAGPRTHADVLRRLRS